MLVEHEMFVGFAHMLASQVYVLQGNPDAALLELRRLRLREEAIRSESLESRARAVAWQMQTRTTERERQRLELSSRDFERLSLEDSLTGIGNRRWFEQRLDKLLSGSADGETICVALLDVDSFKQVNDSFSHLVGDEVLKRIGQILTAHVREGDAPARLAGDEFVVAFRCSYAVAQSICERVTEAVEQFAWDEVANGLQVGISVGLTQASAGDTVAALLARSDAAMYASKPAGAASKDEELHRPQVRRN